jgi:molybdenum cofactor cytidylyltransferase
MANIKLLLLAAGASLRMRSPKQLLPWGSQTLIEHQIKSLLETSNPLSVVLGAYSEEIINVIDKFQIEIYKNENWEKGMGTSISYGMNILLEKYPNVDGVLITLIDQPLLTTAHFKKMLNLFQEGKDQIIVSQSENGWLGAPVLFDKKYFDELLELKGDEGAKLIISKYKNSVQLIDGGAFLKDMDTLEAYHELLGKYTQQS